MSPTAVLSIFGLVCFTLGAGVAILAMYVYRVRSDKRRPNRRKLL